jgi:hypothetical protein
MQICRLDALLAAHREAAAPPTLRPRGSGWAEPGGRQLGPNLTPHTWFRRG